MTIISKKVISWILGALAFVSLVFGVIFAMPQATTAKAANTVVVNFNEYILEGYNN